MDAFFENLQNALNAMLGGGSLLAIAAAFLFGVFVGFTPCVYPILPITVAYIGSVSKGRRINGFIYSLFYVLGMAVVYTTLGVATTIVSGRMPRIWNNGWLLLALANFFILLALWQLHVINIPTPKFLRSTGTRRSGLLGALGVGAASGLIIGPCTLPGLGAMIAFIAEAAKSGSVGSITFGATAMFAYSLGQGSLVLICGTFSGFLAALPKSGRWLAVVEKVFAILMLLAAEFFLIYLGQNANFPELSGLFSSK